MVKAHPSACACPIRNCPPSAGGGFSPQSKLLPNPYNFRLRLSSASCYRLRNGREAHSAGGGREEPWRVAGARLVITDWRLPDGDGIAFADRAADLGTNTAVLTGYAFHMTPERAARHEVWMKPMRPIELIAAIERCIGRDERCAAN